MHDYGIYKQINTKQSHMHCNLPATINHRPVGDWLVSVRQHIQNMPSHGSISISTLHNIFAFSGENYDRGLSVAALNAPLYACDNHADLLPMVSK